VSTVAAIVLVLAAVGGSGPRVLRLAQREHYLAGSVSRFWLRWLRRPPNPLWAAATAAATVAGVFVWPLLLVGAAGLLVGPVGLSWRGRTTKLAWTRRLRTLAGVAAALAVLAGGVLALLASPAVGAAAVALGAPLLVDLACLVTAPVERRLAEQHVRRAAQKLARLAPTVVGITGSYGKTSTKQHLRDLLADTTTVVASPASFNNRAGLSRTVNDHLELGTEVLIAEMGTYGPGEIRELVAWTHPQVAVICAIGPVHLERMGSIANIVRAKREITEGARQVVLNVDSPELDALARELAASTTVVRAGSERADVDVRVQQRDGCLVATIRGETFTQPTADRAVRPTNVACAIGAALALGTEPAAIGRALARLQPAEHRNETTRAPAGFTIIDDTFSANPAGSHDALAALAALPVAGRRVVVTPGMVELGRAQRDENVDLGRRAGAVADVLVVVGWTNRAALRAGARETDTQVVEVAHRAQAVEWVRQQLREGDAVLYENDLPDHYP
jgi:UDP-N-acetylmuramoyl-tripeptide--D-alanyl-D-alanine ligase